MTPASGTRLFLLGLDGVLFCEPRQELHAFNTTACVIWCRLEEGESAAEIAGSLVREHGLDPATAHAHVEMALADWSAKGLFADGPAPPLATPPPEQRCALPPAPRQFVTTGSFRTLGVTVRIRFGDRQLHALIEPLFTHLSRADDRPADITADIAAVDGGVGVWLDGEASAFCATGESLAPAAKAAIWTEVLRRQTFLLQFHAGVVRGSAGCVLLPAEAGSGKSTLCSALAHAGFTLFSDEVALLTNELTVTPFPTAICIKDTGFAAVEHIFPGLRAQPMHVRQDGKRVAYLPPPGPCPPENDRQPVRAIVFPRYRPGAATTTRSLTPAEALPRLLSHCLNVGAHLDTGTVARLVGWMRTMRSLELESSSLDQACSTVASLLRNES